MSKRTQNIPTIIDVEASGFGPDSYPIEIGLVLENGEKYCSLVYPAPHWKHWDEKAEQVHKVTRDILKEYGKPMKTIATELNDLLRSKVVYTDGWVVDKDWIDKLFYSCSMAPEFMVSSLDMILTESQMESWHETKDRILKEKDLQRHRASNDALVIQQTWAETRGMTSK